MSTLGYMVFASYFCNNDTYYALVLTTGDEYGEIL